MGAEAASGRLPAGPVLAGLALLVLGCLALAVGYGPSALGPRGAWRALVDGGAPATARLLLWQVRVPRALAAVQVGACLAASGALMQGVTRNALASPGLMGLGAGGGLAILGATLAWPALGEAALVGVSLLGALGGATLSFGAAALGRGRTSPARLALAGLVVSGLLGSLTGLLVVTFGMQQDLLAWAAGGLHGLRWRQLAVATPLALAGLASAIALAPRITVLSLGPEVAASLGLHPGRVRAAATVAVLLLVVAALALAGPVGFVGLLSPHVARRALGGDYRRVVPAAALLGAAMVLLSDLAGRLLTFAGTEVPLGIFTALAGSLFFVGLARARARSRSWAC